MNKNNNLLIIIPILISVAIGLVLPEFDIAKPIAWTLAITFLTASWWITEAVPIPVASLVPFALLPLAGIIDHKTAASALGSHVILLLMGAFMLSKAIEKSGVHKRLALGMIHLVGGSGGKRLTLAFMITAAFLSMWISNTATVMMLLPIALAIIHHVDDEKLPVALLLGIAFASSVGGMGTLIGTPPNVIFSGVYEKMVGEEYSFLSWMKVGVPIVIISIPLMALWLTRSITHTAPIKLPVVGEWRQEEIRVLVVFGLTAVAWIFRKEPFGGWTGLFDLQGVSDSTIAIFAVVMMFLIPNGKNDRLLDWDHAVQIPWGMLLLFAGGICLAKGFSASGLSDLIGQSVQSMGSWNVWVLLICLTLGVSFLTEIMSNTATATLLMPILASAALGAGIAPELLMVPVALAASAAFMMPVATAPNAIVFGQLSQLKVKDMVKEGFILNLIVCGVIVVVCGVLL